MLILGTESLTERSLGTADNNDTSTVVAIYVIIPGIVVVIIVGLMICFCYEGSHRRRRPPDINDHVTIPVEVVSYKCNEQSA